MMLTPKQEWWTTTELALSGLPDVPPTRQGVDAMADRQNWRAHPEFARRRAGRGGGWEYCWRLLPARAQRRMLTAVAPVAEPKAAWMDRDAAWAWYEALPDVVKGRAQARLLVIQSVEALEPVIGRDLAVRQIAQERRYGARTIWSWLALIDGVRPDDRLPYLAPRHRVEGEGKMLRSKTCSPEFFDLLKSDYLRLERPSFSTSYRRILRIAKPKGWAILPERTMRRRLDAVVSPVTQVLLREGIEAVKRYYPPQVRDKTCLRAMEAVNGDYHRVDVFVRWPGIAEPVRPQLVAFQDIYSGRVLSWRIDLTANSSTVLLAAGDMIEDWGIPEHVLLDNGREFAAKSVTGGTANRYRFVVQDEDVPGLFTSLGCEIHWATPYSGQSKPIERAFRDMCDNIAKDPRFAGAWTGNRPDAKPENYGSRAIPLEEFFRVVAEGIEEHNTRSGRRSEVAFGRSFAEVFDESYVSAPIRKATEAQRRLWLMGAKGVKAQRQSGAIIFMGNRYWAHWMNDIAGEQIVVRFDASDLWAGLHVYTFDGSYLGHAPVLDAKGFFSTEDARLQKQAQRAWLKAEREAARAHVRYQAAQLGQMMDETSPVELPLPEAKVVRLTPNKRGKAAAPSKDAPQGMAPSAGAVITTLPARPAAIETAADIPRERFRRALQLEHALERGEPVTPDQRRWLAGYQTTSEYRSERMLWDDHGDAIFGS